MHFLQYMERCTLVVRCYRLPHTSRHTHSVIGPCVHSHAQIDHCWDLVGFQSEQINIRGIPMYFKFPLGFRELVFCTLRGAIAGQEVHKAIDPCSGQPFYRCSSSQA